MNEQKSASDYCEFDLIFNDSEEYENGNTLVMMSRFRPFLGEIAGQMKVSLYLLLQKGSAIVTNTHYEKTKETTLHHHQIKLWWCATIRVRNGNTYGVIF